MMLYLSFCLVALLNLGGKTLTAAEDPCSKTAYHRESPTWDWTIDIDHRDQIGRGQGEKYIDKITKIEVWSSGTNYDRVLTHMEVTYRLHDKSEVKKSLIRDGRQNNLEGTLIVPDDAYLSSIEMYHYQKAGLFWVDFKLNNGYSTGKIGGNQKYNSNYNIGGTNNEYVIYALRANKAKLVLFAHLTKDRIHNIELYDFNHNLASPPTTKANLDFGSQQAVLVVDNREGSSTQSASKEVSEEVSTSETTSVTSGAESSNYKEATVSAEASFKFGSAGASFTVGSSFTSFNEKTRESSETLTNTITQTLNVEAEPGTKVTGTLKWKMVEYEFDWTGPVRCQYVQAPKTWITGEMMVGKITGAQAYPHAEAIYDTEVAPTSTPTSQPTKAPTTKATVPSPTIHTAPSQAFGDGAIELQALLDGNCKIKVVCDE